MLFRKEVITNKKHQNYGAVSINIPLHYSLITLTAAVLALLIILFFIFAEFSEKFIVKGYVNSTQGVVRVYPNRNGIIVRSSINPGDKVSKGEELFLIDTSYEGLNRQNRQEEFLQLKKRKKSIEREINYKKNNLHDLKRLLDKKYIPLTTYNEKHEELVQLENNKNLIEMDLIKYKQNGSYIIRSPIDGRIASIIYKEGQYINPQKPLVKILPAKSDLVAELFIPIHQSGFLTKKNKIILRYDAYPYERFGSYAATISDISQSILTDEEEEKPLRIGQPYYKVTAELDKQFVTLYGKEKRIHHGMTVSAVIIGSKRKVWQWILDPIYSFYGGLAA